MREADAGGIPAHVEALADHDARRRHRPERLAITRATIDDAMLTYPPLARFPEVEDAGVGGDPRRPHRRPRRADGRGPDAGGRRGHPRA